LIAFRLGNSGQKRRPAELGKNYPAWTRIRRDNIAFSFIENDQPLFEIVDTIVSEHYDDRDPNAARLMERFYYGHKWGWLRWERWEKTGTPTSDLIRDVPMHSSVSTQVVGEKIGG
jgi:hypothetical protein